MGLRPVDYDPFAGGGATRPPPPAAIPDDEEEPVFQQQEWGPPAPPKQMLEEAPSLKDFYPEPEKKEKPKRLGTRPVNYDPFGEGGKNEGFIGDAWTLLKSGAWGTGATMRELVGMIPWIGKPIQGTLDSVDEWMHGEKSETYLKKGQEEIISELSPEGKAARDKKWISDDGGWGDAWADPRSWVSGAIESMPASVLTMLPGGVLARGSYLAKIAAGAGPKVATAAAAKTATIAGSITEGLMGGADTSQQIRQEIMGLPKETIATSQAVQALVSQGMSQDQALEQIANDASTKGFLIASVITGAFGGMGDRALVKILGEGIEGGVLKRLALGAAKGSVSESLFEELPQSAGEQFATNVGVADVDPTRKYTKGVAEAAVGGAIAGGVMGGGFGGVAGIAGRKSDETPDQSDPADEEGVTDTKQPGQDSPGGVSAAAPSPQPQGSSPTSSTAATVVDTSSGVDPANAAALGSTKAAAPPAATQRPSPAAGVTVPAGKNMGLTKEEVTQALMDAQERLATGANPKDIVKEAAEAKARKAQGLGATAVVAPAGQDVQAALAPKTPATPTQEPVTQGPVAGPGAATAAAMKGVPYKDRKRVLAGEQAGTPQVTPVPLPDTAAAPAPAPPVTQAPATPVNVGEEAFPEGVAAPVDEAFTPEQTRPTLDLTPPLTPVKARPPKTQAAIDTGKKIKTKRSQSTDVALVQAALAAGDVAKARKIAAEARKQLAAVPQPRQTWRWQQEQRERYTLPEWATRGEHMDPGATVDPFGMIEKIAAKRRGTVAETPTQPPRKKRESVAMRKRRIATEARRAKAEETVRHLEELVAHAERKPETVTEPARKVPGYKRRAKMSKKWQNVDVSELSSVERAKHMGAVYEFTGMKEGEPGYSYERKPVAPGAAKLGEMPTRFTPVVAKAVATGKKRAKVTEAPELQGGRKYTGKLFNAVVASMGGDVTKLSDKITARVQEAIDTDSRVEVVVQGERHSIDDVVNGKLMSGEKAINPAALTRPDSSLIIGKPGEMGPATRMDREMKKAQKAAQTAADAMEAETAAGREKLELKRRSELIKREQYHAERAAQDLKRTGRNRRYVADMESLAERAAAERERADALAQATAEFYKARGLSGEGTAHEVERYSKNVVHLPPKATAAKDVKSLMRKGVSEVEAHGSSFADPWWVDFASLQERYDQAEIGDKKNILQEAEDLKQSYIQFLRRPEGKARISTHVPRSTVRQTERERVAKEREKVARASGELPAYDTKRDKEVMAALKPIVDEFPMPNLRTSKDTDPEMREKLMRFVARARQAVRSTKSGGDLRGRLDMYQSPPHEVLAAMAQQITVLNEGPITKKRTYDFIKALTMVKAGDHAAYKDFQNLLRDEKYIVAKRSPTEASREVESRDTGRKWLDYTRAHGWDVDDRARRLHDYDLKTMVGDVPIVTLTDEEFYRDRDRDVGAYYRGVFHRHLLAGEVGHIVVPESFHERSAEEQAELIRHEMSHAATHYGISYDLYGTHTMLEELRKEILANHPHLEGWYGLKNAHELVAEVNSNPRFREALGNTKVSPDLARRVGFRDARSLYEIFLDILHNLFRMLKRMPKPVGMSYIDAVTRLTKLATTTRGQQLRRARRAERRGTLPAERDPLDTLEPAAVVNDMWNAAREKAELTGVTKLTSKLGTSKELSRRMQEHLPGPIADAFDELVSLYLSGRKLKADYMQRGNELVSRMIQLKSKNSADMERLSDLANDMTVHKVNVWDDLGKGANAHIDPNDWTQSHAVEQHARLRADFAKLSPEAKKLARDMGEFYRETENLRLKKIVRNILHENLERYGKGLPKGHTIDSLVDWVVSGGVDRKLTVAYDHPELNRRLKEIAIDKPIHDVLGNTAHTLRDAKSMRMIPGYYVPLMRWGKYFISGRRDNIAIPAGATRDKTKPDDFHLLFDLTGDAVRYSKDLKHGEQLSPIQEEWYDKTTGEAVAKPALQNQPNFGVRYRIKVQNKMMEMHNSKRALEELADQYRQQGYKIGDVAEVDKLRSGQSETTSAEVNRLIQNAVHANRGSVTPAQKALVGAIINGYAQQLANTRQIHRRIKRRNIKGWSRDFIHATDIANGVSAGNMAQLDTGTRTSELLSTIDAGLQDERQRGKGKTIFAQHLVNELKGRMEAQSERTADYAGAGLVRGVLQLSFISHLASPAYSATNATQPYTMTYPVLAEEFGDSKATAAMSRAMLDMRKMKLYREGLWQTGKEFAGAFKATQHPFDYSQRVREGLKALPDGDLLVKAYDQIELEGLATSGIEAPDIKEVHMNASQKFLERVSRVARAMPEAIEAVNRTHAMIASVRLAKASGKSDAAAIKYATHAVERSQGGYSAENNPAFMSGNYSQVPLQFKKYPLLFGQMYWRTMYKMVMPGTDWETRKVMFKSWVRLSAVTAALAGTAGLPLMEVAKGLVMAGALFGIGDGDWEAKELALQQWYKDMLRWVGFGNSQSKIGAEMMSYGATRALNIDTSNRFAQNSAVLFGNPDSMQGNDVRAWLFDLMFGAPGGMTLDMAAYVTGQTNKSLIESFPMPKFIADIAKARRMATEGTRGQEGQRYADPVSMGEAIVTATGFRTAKQARTWELGGTAATAREERKVMHHRSTLMTRYANNPEQRTTIQREIREWNRNHKDRRQRIDFKDLQRSKRTVRQKEKERKKLERELAY